MKYSNGSKNKKCYYYQIVDFHYSQKMKLEKSGYSHYIVKNCRPLCCINYTVKIFESKRPKNKRSKSDLKL